MAICFKLLYSKTLISILNTLHPQTHICFRVQISMERDEKKVYFQKIKFQLKTIYT
jgi:hypothetical protein